MSNVEDSVIEFPEEAQEILKQKILEDEAMVALVVLLTHMQYRKETVTINDLAEQVRVRRKVAIRNRANRVIRYEYRDEQPIGRSKVERILEKFEFCTLITVKEQHPAKIISLTPAGAAVLIPVVQEYFSREENKDEQGKNKDAK